MNPQLTNFRPVKVWMLVGMEREQIDIYPETAYPLVAGCVDDLIYEVEPYEDSAKRLERFKQEMTGDPDAYEWREIEVTLNVHELREALMPAKTDGEIGEVNPA